MDRSGGAWKSGPFVRPKKRPCTPKDTILTPGFGYSIIPVPKFPDRPGRENRLHFLCFLVNGEADYDIGRENIWENSTAGGSVSARGSKVNEIRAGREAQVR